MLLARNPAGPLGRAVVTIWTSHRPAGLAHDREWGLPTGHADLIVPLDRDALRRFSDRSDRGGHSFAGGIFQGARDTAVLRDTSSASIVVGAQFRSVGLRAFRRETADEFFGQTLSMSDFWPGFTERLLDSIHQARALANPEQRLACFEQALNEQLLPEQSPDPFAIWVADQLGRGARIGELTRTSGMAPATLIRRYRQATGLRPKQHAALIRFQSALQAARYSHDWSGLAHELGFADQSHLIREFVRLSGMTPGHCDSRRTEFINHVICR